MIVLILSILGSVLSLGGNILIARKKRIGWATWIVGDAAWILVNIFGTMNVPMLLMYLAYFMTNVSGYAQWSKEKDKQGYKFYVYTPPTRRGACK